MDDCAVIVETKDVVKVNVAIPPEYMHVGIDEVENGIMVHATDSDTLHCFVPLPDGVDLEGMQASFHDGLLELFIPKL
jgi:HSP20 family molecular chaperone IbpA